MFVCGEAPTVATYRGFSTNIQGNNMYFIVANSTTIEYDVRWMAIGK